MSKFFRRRIFVCCFLGSIFISVDIKKWKNNTLFWCTLYIMRKYKKIGWLTFRGKFGMSDREPYQNISIFTVYTDIFCTVPPKCQSPKKSSASELPVGTGIVQPAAREKNPSSGLFCLLTAWLPLRIQYLRTSETLWSAREITSVALSTEQERRTENVFHKLLRTQSMHFTWVRAPPVHHSWRAVGYSEFYRRLPTLLFQVSKNSQPDR